MMEIVLEKETNHHGTLPKGYQLGRAIKNYVIQNKVYPIWGEHVLRDKHVYLQI